MKLACVIPLYNHARTVLAVARKAKEFIDDVRVVDDGSSDLPGDFDRVAAEAAISVLHHDRNRGKGAALKTAAKALAAENVDFMIVMDADGQHDAADLPKLIGAVSSDPSAIVVGCRDFSSPDVPGASRFGRDFSNFWCRLETGIQLGDTQSGFRAYPVSALNSLHLKCDRYNFEIEALVKLIWAGFHVAEVPVSVSYRDRVSHFDQLRDNIRLSLLHTSLVCRRVLPIPHQRLAPGEPEKTDLRILLHPIDFCRMLLKENADPAGLAASAAVGTYFAVLPLIGIHMAVILYLCIRLKLNKVMALAIQNLFMPPFSPFLCIEVGYWMRHGHFWTDFSLQTCVAEIPYRIFEWFLGSLVLAPFWAVIAWLAVYSTASLIARRRT